MITCPEDFSISPVPSTPLPLLGFCETLVLSAVPSFLCEGFIAVPKRFYLGAE